MKASFVVPIPSSPVSSSGENLEQFWLDGDGAVVSSPPLRRCLEALSVATTTHGSLEWLVEVVQRVWFGYCRVFLTFRVIT
jgi:hypothetical protein